MAEPEETEDRQEKKGGKAEYITPPHTIRTKVSGGGPLTSQMLQKAEEVVQQHAEKYIERAQDQIDALVEVVQEAEAETGDKAALFEKIFLQAHDIRGLGSTFGYTLVTNIAASLCNFVEAVDNYDEDVMEVLNAHVDALRGMIGTDVKGDGGPIGREILDGLMQAVAKNAPKPSEETAADTD
ncbi:MAG: Hpt domain-containing protein [Rhodospirillaceae bacterium]|nr:Hpt domain-containing protein [Rhodospirillaceae bacterium]